MARGNDRKDKQEKRAREEVEKGLKRGDLDLALGSFGELAEADRAAFEPKVGAMLRPAMLAAHKAGGWAKLAQVAAKVERAFGLVSSGAGEREAAEVWWALLWGCVRQRDLERAAKLWARLAPSVADAPRLAAAVAAIVEGKDTFDAGVLAALSVGEEAEVDVRPVPPPARGEDIDEAVLVLCGSRPWGVAADVLGRWSRQLPAAEAAAALSLGGKLAARELLVRVSQGKDRPADSLPLLALAARELPGSPTLEAPLAAAVRALLKVATVPELGRDARALLAYLPPLASALAGYPEHATTVARALASLPLDEVSAREALPLFERMLSSSPSAALWLQTAACWTRVERADESLRPPPSAGLEGALARIGPSSLSPEVLRALPPGSLCDGLALVGRVAKPAAVEQIFEACSPGATDAIKDGLSAMIGNLMGRAGSVVAQQMRAQVGGGLDPETDAMMKELAASVSVDSLEAEGLLRKLAPRALRGNSDLFEVLLATEQDEERIARLIDAYAAGSPSFTRWLSMLMSLDGAGRSEVAWVALAQAIERFEDDVEALSEATISLVNGQAPRRIAAAVAAALLDAVERTPSSDPSALLVIATELARGLYPDRPRPEARPLGTPAKLAQPQAELARPQAERAPPQAEPVPMGIGGRGKRAKEKKPEDQLSLLLTDPTPQPPAIAASLAAESGEGGARAAPGGAGAASGGVAREEKEGQ